MDKTLQDEAGLRRSSEAGLRGTPSVVSGSTEEPDIGQCNQDVDYIVICLLVTRQLKHDWVSGLNCQI